MEASAIETHPFVPFLPGNARLLMLGTFPPAPKRWSMAWYYPNFTNDMWRIFGLIFFGDKQHFVCQEEKTYRLDALKDFLTQRGVAHRHLPAHTTDHGDGLGQGPGGRRTG